MPSSPFKFGHFSSITTVKKWDAPISGYLLRLCCRIHAEMVNAVRAWGQADSVMSSQKADFE